MIHNKGQGKNKKWEIVARKQIMKIQTLNYS
jgi:hypothetical protein